MTKRATVFVLIGLSTFFIGLFMSQLRSFVETEPREISPWHVLLSFENQDLQGLNDDARATVRKAVMAVTGQQDSDFVDPFRPAFFREVLNTRGEKRYVLIEEASLLQIPGDSRLRVHVFNACGRLLTKDEFSAGWRFWVTGFRVRKQYVLDQDALIVDTEYWMGGHTARQFYAVIDDRITLIYQTADGQFDRNNYHSSNMTVGPLITRSADNWEKALNSADKAEVLSALMWLAGIHWNGQPKPYDEDRAEAEKVATLRARDTVRKRLKELSESNDYWLQTAATAVLENDK